METKEKLIGGVCEGNRKIIGLMEHYEKLNLRVHKFLSVYS